MRHENGLRIFAHDDPGVHEEAGKQFSVRVGELGAQRDGVGVLIHVHAGEVQMPGCGIGAAVGHGQQRGDGRGFHIIGLAFFLKLFFEGIEVVRRLGHFDVHRVRLIYGGKRGGLIGRQQCAHGKVADGDAAADGRPHFGSAVIDFRRFHRGGAGLYRGFRLLQGRLGVVVVLLAHGFAPQHVGRAAFAQPGHLQIGFRAGKIGARLVQRGFIGVRLYAVQDVAFLDHGPFGKAEFLEYAAHFGPHFGPAVCACAAGQLAFDGHGLRRQRHRGDLNGATCHGGRGGLRIVAEKSPDAVAAGKHKGKRQQERRESTQFGHRISP